jgi:hypothetical protein
MSTTHARKAPANPVSRYTAYQVVTLAAPAQSVFGGGHLIPAGTQGTIVELYAGPSPSFLVEFDGTSEGIVLAEVTAPQLV